MKTFENDPSSRIHAISPLNLDRDTQSQRTTSPYLGNRKTSRQNFDPVSESLEEREVKNQRQITSDLPVGTSSVNRARVLNAKERGNSGLYSGGFIAKGERQSSQSSSQSDLKSSETLSYDEWPTSSTKYGSEDERVK